MKFRGKILSAILASSMVLTLAGCGEDKGSGVDVNLTDSSSAGAGSEEKSLSAQFWSAFDGVDEWDCGDVSVSLSMGVDSDGMLVELSTQSDGTNTKITLDSMKAYSDTYSYEFNDVQLIVSESNVYVNSATLQYLTMLFSGVNMDTADSMGEMFNSFDWLQLTYEEVGESVGVDTEGVDKLDVNEMFTSISGIIGSDVKAVFEPLESEFFTEDGAFVITTENLGSLLNAADTLIDNGTVKKLYDSLSEEAGTALDVAEWSEETPAELKEAVKNMRESMADSHIDFKCTADRTDDTLTLVLKGIGDGSLSTGEVIVEGSDASAEEGTGAEKTTTSVSLDCTIVMKNVKPTVEIPSGDNVITMDGLQELLTVTFESPDEGEIEPMFPELSDAEEGTIVVPDTMTYEGMSLVTESELTAMPLSCGASVGYNKGARMQAYAANNLSSGIRIARPNLHSSAAGQKTL